MGSSPPSLRENTDDMLLSLARYAPDAIRAIADTTPYTAQKQLEVERATAPGYSELQTQLYRQQAPELARIGSDVDRQQQLAAAQTEALLAGGRTGQQLVSAADTLQRQLDPEYYRTRARLDQGISTLLGGYDPYQLNASELENINRGLARSQGPTTSSQQQTIANAMTFGQAGQNRWNNFANTLAQVAAGLPQLKSGIGGFEVATRRKLSSPGEQQFVGVTNPGATSATGTNFGFANNLMNEIGGTNRNLINRRRDFDERVNQAIGSLSGIV